MGRPKGAKNRRRRRRDESPVIKPQANFSRDVEEVLRKQLFIAAWATLHPRDRMSTQALQEIYEQANTACALYLNTVPGPEQETPPPEQANISTDRVHPDYEETIGKHPSP